MESADKDLILETKILKTSVTFQGYLLMTTGERN